MRSSNIFITVTELSEAITAGRPPVLIDVRKQPAFEASDRMIATAIWRDPTDIENWMDSVPSNEAVVVYCVHGHEVSQGAASTLCAAGVDAVYLEGGFEDFAAAGGQTVAKPDL